jgi:hypothetical protein
LTCKLNLAIATTFPAVTADSSILVNIPVVTDGCTAPEVGTAPTLVSIAKTMSREGAKTKQEASLTNWTPFQA